MFAPVRTALLQWSRAVELHHGSKGADSPAGIASINRKTTPQTRRTMRGRIIREFIFRQETKRVAAFDDVRSTFATTDVSERPFAALQDVGVLRHDNPFVTHNDTIRPPR